MGTDIHLLAEVFRNGRWHMADVDLPCDRNYVSFAVLADVRNGYSFAGFDTGDPVIPISEPRGLPDDLSAEPRASQEDGDQEDSWLDEQSSSWINEDQQDLWLGEHSFSWVTLEELLEYDLEAPIILRGLVPPEQAKRFQELGEPPRSVTAYRSKPGWVRLEWQVPLREKAWLVLRLIEALRSLGLPQHVRLVFGFDN